MKVSEFIDWLKKQDQDAIVTCLVHDHRGNYYEQGGTCSEKDFTVEYSDYIDFRGNRFVKETDEHFNQRFLLIGGRE